MYKNKSVNNCLTMRECEVACYIVQGRANKYIAAELGVSQRTIEAHRSRIFMKLGVRNAVQLTAWDGAQKVSSECCSFQRVFQPTRQSGQHLPGVLNETVTMAAGRLDVPFSVHLTG